MFQNKSILENCAVLLRCLNNIDNEENVHCILIIIIV